MKRRESRCLKVAQLALGLSYRDMEEWLPLADSGFEGSYLAGGRSHFHHLARSELVAQAHLE
jgi:hypothetical protein